MRVVTINLQQWDYTMPMTEINSTDVIGKGNVLLDFYTTTCAPCRALHPVLEEISKEWSSLKVCKVNVNNNFDLSQQFGVMSVPTLVLMVDSKVREVSQGFPGKDAVKSMVRKHIGAPA